MKKTSTGTTSKSSRGQTRRAITPEDLLQLHIIADPQISPDGSTVLFAKKHVGEKNDYETNLWLVGAETSRSKAAAEPRQFTSGKRDGHGRWSPDGKQIAFISARDKPKPQIFLMAATGGEAVPLTKFPEGAIRGFQWSPDGRLLAVAYRETETGRTKEAEKTRESTGASAPPQVIDDFHYRLDGDGYFRSQRFQLYIVEVATGEHRLLRRERASSFEFDWAPDSSELVVAVNTNREPALVWWKEDLLRVDVKSGKSERIEGLPVGAKQAVRWSPDGRTIVFAGREGKEAWGVHNTRLYVYEVQSQRCRDLTGSEDYCLTAATLSDSAEPAFGALLEWSPDSRRIFTNIGWHGESHIASIPAAGGPLTFHTKGRSILSLGNLSADGTRAALTVSDPVSPGEVAVGSLANAAAPLNVKVLTHFNAPLLKQLEISAPEPHWINSADGTKVHVWVIKPVGFRAGRKYPAVLEIHGGPHAQYGETFFHEFQVLAAAGYVVVYSNPRGSKGYGDAHCAAIKGAWGQADWRDMQAVIGFMKGLPYVDMARMGVMGGSYGGYMTNWTISHSNEFAGAITDRCVSNLVSMVGSSDLPLVPGEYWEGNSWDNTEAIWEQSPLKHFGNVNTPTLIIHSEGDLRCNVEQAEQVFVALKLRKVPTRFVRYPSTTSHGLSRSGPPDLRLHRLHQILDWWKKYLG
ncbi:MAG TPA: S9 family peptidase [Planctomycetaceae bacterium]|jgi:dipeptidyl aminopeptidase/acylaminoacyl peptidase|nr:S9 family peptidase [Planctomycetaceae bacterium]